MNSTDPTNDQFAAYRAMWAYFNTTLFGGTLGHIFLNFSRLARSLGFFSPERWRNAGNQTTHEISLNPDHLTHGNAKDSASTLVHEMAHLWRWEQGMQPGSKPPRSGYHDTKWADKMVEIGLMPSDTGKPGGKRTGYRMGHYIIPGGAFERAFDAMPAECQLPWTAVDRDRDNDGDDGESVEGVAKPDEADEAKKTAARKVKVKYSCPDCELNVWGKPGLNLHCNECDEDLVAEGSDAVSERAAILKAA